MDICMKQLFFLLLLVQTSVSAIADEDYANKEVTAPMELSTVGTGVPVIATKACSHAEMLYKHEYMNLMQGDFITQLTYNGYNPGEPFSRHITVWMSNTEQRNFNNQADMAPTSTMTKVFDGDCTIAAGGSVNERIPLLTIPLDQPFEYGGYTVRVVIESTGEPVSQDVCFEQYKERWVCRYTTAEENGGQWSEPEYSQFPLTTLTVATPVVNLTGTVCNQDKIPIPNATIQLKSTSYPSTTIYTGETDGDGNYAIRIEEGNKYYMATVSAPGCATYTETWRGTAVKEKSQWDFTLYDAVAYKAGQRATIIMPVAPDASAGRYYRLDRTEGSQLVFEREPSPQANVPYVIFPDRDFSVDLKPLDLSGEAGKTSVPGVDFVGSYINYDFPTTTNQELIFLDETNDGGYEFKSDESYGGNYVVGGRIAALRACIIENGWYGKDIVFHDDNSVQPGDEGTVGMSVLSGKAGGTVTHDLQGRRMQGKPAKGVYILDGRKVVVK